MPDEPTRHEAAREAAKRTDAWHVLTAGGQTAADRDVAFELVIAAYGAALGGEGEPDDARLAFVVRLLGEHSGECVDDCEGMRDPCVRCVVAQALHYLRPLRAALAGQPEARRYSAEPDGREAVSGEDLAQAIDGVPAGQPEVDERATDADVNELIEMPRDLLNLLRDPSIIIRQDAAVFELIAKWQKAPSPTMARAALPDDTARKPERKMSMYENGERGGVLPDDTSAQEEREATFVRGDRVKGTPGLGTVVVPSNSAGNVGVYWDRNRLSVVEWPRASLLTRAARTPQDVLDSDIPKQGIRVQWARPADIKPGEKALHSMLNVFRRVGAVRPFGEHGGYEIQWEGDEEFFTVDQELLLVVLDSDVRGER